MDMHAPPAPCVITDSDLPARYVSGRVSGSERDDFETHLLSCARCCAAVEEAATIRSALRARKRMRRLAAAAPFAAVALLLIGVRLRPSDVRRLGRVNAPSMEVMEVRGSADSGAVATARAVALYRERRYPEAASAAAHAYRLNQQTGTAFLSGAAYLMAGAPDSAIAAFRRVIAAGTSSYSAEANYYAAKAWLQLGSIDSATAHLRRAGESVGPTAKRARALGDSVDRLK
jgi:tetratricopeptide (TPR) repeat protein